MSGDSRPDVPYTLRRALFGMRYAEDVIARQERSRSDRLLKQALKQAAQDDPELALRVASELMDSDDWSSRYCAVLQVARLRDDRCAAFLRRALEDPDSDVVCVAARGLGQVGDRTAVDDLLTVLDHEYSLPREAAARALGRIPHRSAVPRLVGALEDVEPLVQRAAAWALGQIETRESAEALSRERPRRWRTRRALMRARRHLRDANPELFEK